MCCELWNNLSRYIRNYLRFRVLFVALGVIGVFVLLSPGTTEEENTALPTETADKEECVCNGEMMCHRPYIDQNLTIRETGKRFSCDLVESLKRTQMSVVQRTKNNFTVDDIVFITYASSNHFEESRAFVANVVKEFPKNRIVYYDLGLTSWQVAEFKTQCQLDYRQLDFSKYPPHVRDLSTYAFKTVIAAEAYKELELFWVLDASIRVSRTNTTELLLQSMCNGTIPPFCTPSRTYFTTTQMTHFGMYRYLPTTKVRSDQRQLSAVALVMRSPFAAEVMKWMYLCALTHRCIAPLGSFVQCQKRNNFLIPQCHRFDQSVMNIVLRNVVDENEYRHWQKDLGTRFGKVFTIKREHKRKKKLEPKPCNKQT